MPDGRYHGVRSAARILGCTPTTLYVLAAKGLLRPRLDPTGNGDYSMWWHEGELVRYRDRVTDQNPSRMARSEAERDRMLRNGNV